jgi:hypothetical protein
MCGGPTQQQKAAAASTAQLTGDEVTQFEQGSAATNPFYEGVIANGIPGLGAQQQYSTSDLAGNINAAKANLAGKEAGYGSALPSGFAQQEQADVGIGGAQAFDQNQLSLLAQNFAAKMGAAQALNPQQAASTAVGGNQSILQAPLQNNFWGNLVGGLVQGAGNIPFAFSG